MQKQSQKITILSLIALFLAIALSYTNCADQNSLRSSSSLNSDADSIVNAFNSQEQISVIITYGNKVKSGANQQKLNSNRAQILSIIQSGKENYKKISGKSISSNVRELKKYPVLETSIDKSTYESLKSSGLPLAMLLNRELRPNTYSIAEKIGAIESHTNGYTGSGVTVAVVDSGVDPDHPLFKDSSNQRRVLQGSCIVSLELGGCNGKEEELETGNSYEPVEGDYSGLSNSEASQLRSSLYHGTHVAGIIAAKTTNSISGIAPDANIFPIRITGDEGGSNIYSMLAAFEHLTDVSQRLGIKAVNVSMGIATYSAYSKRECDMDWRYEGFSMMGPFTMLVNDLKKLGISVVAAAGNEYLDHQITFPACVTGVVSVGAYGYSGSSIQVAEFSNHANWVDIMAPGVDVLSSFPNGQTGYMSGTSQATPYVAGAIAVLNAAYPNFTPEEYLGALKRGASYGVDNRIKYPIPFLKLSSALAAISENKILYTLDDFDYQDTSLQGDNNVVPSDEADNFEEANPDGYDFTKYGSQYLSFLSFSNSGVEFQYTPEAFNHGAIHSRSVVKLASNAISKISFKGRKAGYYQVFFYLPKLGSLAAGLPSGNYTNSSGSGEIRFYSVDIYHARSEQFYHDGLETEISLSSAEDTDWYIDHIDMVGQGKDAIKDPNDIEFSYDEQNIRVEYASSGEYTLLDIPKLDRSQVGTYSWYKDNSLYKVTDRPYLEMNSSNDLAGEYSVQIKLEGSSINFMSESIFVKNFDETKQSAISFETEAIEGRSYRYLKIYYKNSLISQMNINKSLEYQSVIVNVPNIDSADLQFEVSE